MSDRRTAPSSASAEPIRKDPRGDSAKKNEVFVDLLERQTVVFNASVCLPIYKTSRSLDLFSFFLLLGVFFFWVFVAAPDDDDEEGDQGCR